MKKQTWQCILAGFIMLLIFVLVDISVRSFLFQNENTSNNISSGRLLLRLDRFNEPSDLVLFNADGSKMVNLRSYFGSPAWSRDGHLVAVECRNQADSHPYLCILDMDYLEAHFDDLPSNKPITKEIARLPLPGDCDIVDKENTREYSGVLSVSWSPNNDEMAIVCRKMATVDSINSIKSVVCIISFDKDAKCWNSDLSKQARRVSWSPDKDLLAVSGVEGYDSKIYLVDPDGVNPEFLTNGWSAEWSPLGDELAFIAVKGKSAIDTAIRGLAIVEVASKQQRWVYVPDLSTDWSVDLYCENSAASCRLTWSPDGRYIAFLGVLRHPFNIPQLYKVEVKSGEISLIVHVSIFHSFVDEPAWGP
jgi:dipeptidyl aminopeptidase/acylaminoacyl peptidase